MGIISKCIHLPFVTALSILFNSRWASQDQLVVVQQGSPADSSLKTCANLVGTSDYILNNTESDSRQLINFWVTDYSACHDISIKHDGFLDTMWIPSGSSDNLYLVKKTEFDNNINDQSTSRGAIPSRILGNPFDSTKSKARLYHTGDWGMVMGLDVVSLDMYTRHPDFSNMELIHLTPLEDRPVEKHAVQRIVDLLENLEYNKSIDKVLKSINKKHYKKFVQTLSGEHHHGLSAESRWFSRHSMSIGGRKASQWLYRVFTDYGFTCDLQSHHEYFSPNVVCHMKGALPKKERKAVILGAHYDSRGSFGEVTAPGADDDASGTAHLLSVARAIAENDLSFQNDLYLIAFSGEEQGLRGSQYYAEQLRKENEVDVLLMIQADMIAFRKPGEPLQVAFPDLIGLPEATYFVGNVSSIYTPELEVGVTPACCSDHQSFVAQGFPSTWVFERNGPIADPFYHNSGDLSKREGYSFEQGTLISRTVFAAALHALDYQ